MKNLFMPYANNKEADQPVHMCSLISVFVFRCLESIIPPFSISENFKPLASLCGCAGRFESYLVAIPKDRFSRARLIWCYDDFESFSWPFILLNRLKINLHLQSGLFHPYQLDKFISIFRGVWCTFSFFIDFEKIFLLVNSEDPDQTLPSAASDLGLHCLPI